MWLEVIGGLALGAASASFGYLKNRAALKLIADRPPSHKSLAVVIATRNEEDVVENTIRCLLNGAPPEARVLVVDESTDSTFRILKGLMREFPNLEAIRNPGIPGKPDALNAALDRISEDIVLFLDADARVDWSFVETYLRAFSDPEVIGVFADFQAYNRKRSFPVVLQDVFFSFAKTFFFSGLLSRPLFMNCGLFIRREVFEVVGKFNPYTLVDDFDLGLRMRKRGLGVRFVPGPKCGIQYALTLRDMFGQHRRWYTGGIREIQEEIRQGRYLYILVLVGAGVAMLFPLIVISLGYIFPSGALRHTVLPVALSTLYFAALSGYLLQTHPGLREATLGALLGIPVIYLFTLGAMLVSLVSAQRRGTWYKVKRERA